MSQKSFAFPPPPPPPRRNDGYCQPTYHGQHAYGPGQGSYNHELSNRGPRGRGSFTGNGRNHSSGGFRGRGGSQYGRESAPGSTNHHNGHGQQNRARGANQTTLGGSSSSKRSHAQAFHDSFQPRYKPQAAPAVPSFNAAIPGLVCAPPPTAPAQPLEKKKKPRTQNQLGLTPAREEHESSEDDEDEESKLAKSATSGGIAFEHGGHTLRLQTATEIAAWLAERRKRYPTAARAEAAKQDADARKKRWEEEKRLRQEETRKRRDDNERQKRELRKKLEELQSEKENTRAKSSATRDDKAANKAEKARLKTEKLQNKAEKVTQKLLKAREALRKAQAKSATEQVDHVDDRDSAISMADHVDLDHDKGEETSKEEDALSIVSDSSTVLDSDEETSSSGSSDSEGHSVSEPNSLPEETTIRRTGPELVLPSSRKAVRESSASNVCRMFLKSGRCKFGKKCHYSHELPPGTRKIVPPPSVRPHRKTLYEAMVEKEQEEERKQVLRAIIALGERGMLDEPRPSGTTTLDLADQEPCLPSAG